MATANVQIKKILVGRGNTAVSSAYSGTRGEITMDTGLNTLRIHDGTTVGGIRLATYSEVQQAASGNIDISSITANVITAVSANLNLTSVNANVAAANAAIAGLRANIIASNVVISSVNANLGAFQTYANATFGTSSYGNANVAAYLLANPQGSTYSNTNVVAYLSHVAGNVIPASNVTYSLGDPTHQWKSLYVSGQTIYIGGIALSVGANGLSSTAGFDLANANATTLTSGNIVSDGFFFSNGVSVLGTVAGTYSNANVVAYMDSFYTYANATYSTTTYVDTRDNATRTMLQNNVSAINSNVSTLSSNASSTYSNVRTIQSQINSINANVAAANATIASNYSTFLSNAGAAHSEIDGLRANIIASNSVVASQTTDINNLRANITAANAVVNTFRANVGSFYTWANTNFGTSSYANANVAAFLTTYNGNLKAANATIGTYAPGNFGLHTTGDSVAVGMFNTSALTVDSVGNLLLGGTGHVRITGASGSTVTIGGGSSGNVYVPSGVVFNDGTKQTTAYTGYGDANVAALLDNGINITTGPINFTSSPPAYSSPGISWINGFQSRMYGNTEVATYLPAYSGNLTPGNLTVSTNAVVLGNLRVQGTQTTVNAATLTVNDLWVTVANGAAQASDANGAGIRVAGALANIAYSSVSDSFEFNKAISVGSIINNSNTWTFGSTGTLSTPTGLEIKSDQYGENIDATNSSTPGALLLKGKTVYITGEPGTGGFAQAVFNNTDGMLVHTNDGTNTRSWAFAPDGTFNLPETTLAGQAIIQSTENIVVNANGQSYTFGADGTFLTQGIVKTNLINNLSPGQRITIDPDNSSLAYFRADGFDDGGERVVISNQFTNSGGIYFYTEGGYSFRMAGNQFKFADDTWQSTAWTGTVANLTLGANVVALNSDGNLVLPTNWNFMASPAVSGTGIIFGDGTYQYTAAGPSDRLVSDGNEVVLNGNGELIIENTIRTQPGQYYLAQSDTSIEMSWANSVQDPNTNVSSAYFADDTGVAFGTYRTDDTGNWIPKLVSMDFAGNLTVPGNFLPTVDNTQDLGSATMRFRHLYVGPGTVYVGNAAIKTTSTGNLILPGLTRAVASSAYAEEVEDTRDQTHSFATIPTVIDNAQYELLTGGQVSSFTPAEYSVVQLDGEGFIDGINIESRGSGYADDVAALAEQGMWATEAADPINSFNIRDWIQIPFRVRSRAGESEFKFSPGGGADLGDFNITGSTLESDTSNNFVNMDVDGDEWMRLGTYYNQKLQLITTWNVGSDKKIWEFTTGGNLTLPSHGNINFANGVNILSTVSGGGSGLGDKITLKNNNYALDFGTSGSNNLGAPNNTDYKGERLVLWDNSGAYDNEWHYAIGMQDNHMWFGVDKYNDSGWGFKWYGQNHEILNLDSAGTITLGSTSTGIFWSNGDPYSTGGTTTTTSPVTVDNEPPSSPSAGDLWYNTDDGRTYVRWADTWIDADPTVAPAPSFYLGNSLTIDDIAESGRKLVISRDANNERPSIDSNSIDYIPTTLLEANDWIGVDSSYMETAPTVTFANGETRPINGWNTDSYGTSGFLSLATGITISGDDAWPITVTAYNYVHPQAVLNFGDNTLTVDHTGNLLVNGNLVTGAGSEVQVPNLDDYHNNIYINAENRGLIVDAGGDRRFGFMKYYGIEGALVHNSAVPIRIGRTAETDISQATAGSLTTEMYIAANGKIGINTVGPTTQLDVNGVIKARNGLFLPQSGSGGIFWVDGSDNTLGRTYLADGNLNVLAPTGFVATISSWERINATATENTTVRAFHDVVLVSNNESVSHTWTFARDGNLVVPGDITGAGTEVVLTADTTDWAFYSNANLVLPANTTMSSRTGINIDTNSIKGIPSGVTNWNGQGGWNQGSYTNLATTGGTGTGLTVDVAAGGGGYINISAITIHTPGSGYTDGDVITINNENNLPGQFVIDGVTDSAVRWRFGADGNITLPTNAKINYANGRSILSGITGGAADTGNITFNDTTVSSTSGNVAIAALDGDGGTGARITVYAGGGEGPDPGTNGGNIDITAGYDSGVLDDPYWNPDTYTGGRINITTAQYNGGDVKNWAFDPFGNLLLPNGSRIDAGLDGYGIGLTTGRGTILFGNSPEIGQPNHFHIMKEDATNVDLYFGDDTDYLHLPDTGSVEIGANGKTWTFGRNGNLVLPGAIGLIGAIEESDSVDLYGNSDAQYVQINYNNQNFVYVDSAGAHMQAGPSAPGQYEVFLATDGSTTFPDHKPVSITGNLTVGNLIVNGTSTTITTTSYSVTDNIVQFAADNPADTLDIGFVGHRTVNSTLEHTGLVRDASTGLWKLFSNVTAQPGTTVDFSNAIFDDLQLDKLYADTVHLTGTAPSTSLGASGDQAGDIHVDANYLYYCTQDWAPSSWNMGSGLYAVSNTNYVGVAYGDFPTPQAGWAISFTPPNGITRTYTVDHVADDAGSLRIYTVESGVTYLLSPYWGDIYLVNPNPPAIWKTVPLNTFATAVTGTYSNANVASYLTANPQSGTYSNANVVAYLAGNSVPSANTAANVTINTATGANFFYTFTFGNVGDNKIYANAVTTGLRYNPVTNSLAGGTTATFATSIQTTSIVAAAVGVNIFNTTASTINMGGQAANILIGNTSGVSTNVILGGSSTNAQYSSIGNLYAGNAHASVTTTGNLNITGNVVQRSAYYETYSNITNTGGNLVCNFANSATFYATLTANVTANIYNVANTAGTVTSVTLIVDQGATPFSVANLQINGGGIQTIRWAGGAGINPGTGSNTDIMSFSLINLGAGARRVLGQISNYG